MPATTIVDVAPTYERLDGIQLTVPATTIVDVAPTYERLDGIQLTVPATCWGIGFWPMA